MLVCCEVELSGERLEERCLQLAKIVGRRPH